MKKDHLNMLNLDATDKNVEILDEDDNDQNEQIKIPYGTGIAGYVASTGQTLNIQDAYLDPRFNSTIDKLTGYKTKSILCLPILNENGECIAVAEAINKSNDFYEEEIIDVDEHLEDLSCKSSPSFTKQDEEVLITFKN
jgi:GAF domain-containing protein